MERRFINRLRRDLQTLQKNHKDEFPVEIPNDDMKLWIVGIEGPKGSVYQGEKYKLRFRFPSDYPIEAPEVVFLGTPPDHEHIYSNGFICLSVLYDGWSAAMSVASLCLSIQSMLASAPKKTKPANDADLCRRSKNKSPKDFIWTFDDDTC